MMVKTEVLVLLGFNETQQLSHQLVEDRVIEMYDMQGLGFVSLNLSIDERISKIKKYQKICHEILSVIQRQMLDGMSSTIWTMRTKKSQLGTLILICDSLSGADRNGRLGIIRVEINDQTEAPIRPNGKFIAF